jgi:hypothetical protein
MSVSQISSLAANAKVAQAARNAITPNTSSLRTTNYELRTAVDEFVGTTFFGALMRQARDAQDAESPFHGGAGEKAFGAQLDAEFVQRVGRRFQSSLGEAIYRKLSKARAGRSAARPAQRITREPAG